MEWSLAGVPVYDEQNKVTKFKRYVAESNRVTPVSDFKRWFIWRGCWSGQDVS
jgi:hypothetical protein